MCSRWVGCRTVKLSVYALTAPRGIPGNPAALTGFREQSGTRPSLSPSIIYHYIIILHLKMPFTEKLSSSRQETKGRAEQQGSTAGIKTEEGIPASPLCSVPLELFFGIRSSGTAGSVLSDILPYRTGAACGPSQAFITFGSGKRGGRQLARRLGGRRRSSLASPLLSHLRLHFAQLQ